MMSRLDLGHDGVVVGKLMLAVTWQEGEVVMKVSLIAEQSEQVVSTDLSPSPRSEGSFHLRQHF